MGLQMIIRVRSEAGIFRANVDDAARGDDVVSCLQDRHAQAFPPALSLELYHDAKCTAVVDHQKSLKDQGIGHGTMLYGKVSSQWPCSSCTFLNTGERTVDSVCEMCQTPVLQQGPARTDKRPLQADQASSAVPTKKRATESGVLRGGFLCFRGPESGATLESFLQQYRPTQVSTGDCAWISVSNLDPQSPGYRRPSFTTSSSSDAALNALANDAPYRQALSNISDIIARGQKVKASDKKTCVDEILRIAVSGGDTVGKWMLFMPHDKVDTAWEKIAQATVEGRLGCSAKVAPSKELGTKRALICVYVSDFSNRKEVKRVLQGVVSLRFFVASGFKLDVYTLLGIDSGNPFRLEPTIYKPKDVLDNWDD